MIPSQLNKRVVSFLHAELLTNQVDIDRLERYGLLLVRSSDFIETVAIMYGSEGVFVLNQFYKSFLGKYDLVCVDKSPLGIRFCNQVVDGGQEGVQLVFHSGFARLQRLTANFGTTTFTTLQDYVL
jgi:hypothetical protein